MRVKRLEVPFVFKKKSQDKINDDGAAKCEKREVDKIHPHCCGTYAQFISQPLTNPKSLLFEPLCDLTNHTLKIQLSSLF
jgi:hypothetical protein